MSHLISEKKDKVKTHYEANFTCEICEKEFVEGRKEQNYENEVKEEFLTNFPDVAEKHFEDGDKVCGYCYHEAVQWWSSLSEEEKQKIQEENR